MDKYPTFTTIRARSNQLTLINAVYIFLSYHGQAGEVVIIRQVKQYGHPGVSHCDEKHLHV